MSRAAPPEILTVQVPFIIRKRGGRKEIVVPEGAAGSRLRVDNTLVKALARAFRWKRMVIPPFLTGCIRRTYAAIFSFCAGVTPPMPMFGRSLL